VKTAVFGPCEVDKPFKCEVFWERFHRRQEPHWPVRSTVQSEGAVMRMCCWSHHLKPKTHHELSGTRKQGTIYV